MTRTEFKKLHRLARTFLRFSGEAFPDEGVIDSGDGVLLRSLLHWFHTEYRSETAHHDMAEFRRYPGPAVSHTSILLHMRRHQPTARYEEEKKRRLSAARMARYFRSCPKLPG